MDTSAKVAQLAKYVEERLRASKSDGIEFVDPRHLAERLTAKQNHVVFGRRGAGKSTLVSSLGTLTGYTIVYLDLEEYKDITFPNIIVQVLLETFKNLRREIHARYPWYKAYGLKPAVRSVSRSLRRREKELQKLLSEPDKEERQVRTRSSREGGGTVSLSWEGTGIEGHARQGSEIEVERTVPRDKLNHLRLEIPNYKELLSKVSSICKEAPIFLILDDFYFVRKQIQPDLLDYFHRMTKDTKLFLKIATIKHRSRLYRRSNGTYVGAELGQDIHEIDMDYTLDDFEELKSFMRQLLESANRRSGADLDIDTLFEGDGFQQLCLASGGVPRDFLSLFVKLANKVIVAEQRSIGKVKVTEEAIANVNIKLENFNTDSGDEESILEIYLSTIKDRIYRERRTNAFLVGRQELEDHPQARQAIRELLDLRLVHLVEKNTSSAPSDGLRYEAYILDVGLYDNARPRNFNQIEPGQRDARSRRDELRAAPKLSLSRVEGVVVSSGIQQQLLVTE